MIHADAAMNLTKRTLTGLEYLAAATHLLQRIRMEGAFAGLYEAADVQWWWREDDAAIPDRQVFWFDAQEVAVACLSRFDAGDEWLNAFMALPSAQPAVEAQVLPEVVAAISGMSKPSTMTVREDDRRFQAALTAAGFLLGDHVLVQAELVREPAQPNLPPGFQLTSRVGERRPHHMIRRNGHDVARKLGECSLYRADLDLCVRDPSGTVAAYALFWMDPVTQVGLLEPMRTEAEYQRKGLATYLIAAGVARLRELGAESIRVSYDAANRAAANLYHRAGFEDWFRKLEFRREPEPTNT